MNLDQRARVNRTIDQAPPDYADVRSWKEAWYLQRAIIGWLQLRHWYDRSEVHGLRRIRQWSSGSYSRRRETGIVCCRRGAPSERIPEVGRE